MPAHKKKLPRSCPQCGLENGGMQWVIFNPRFSNSRRYNEVPYSILRISHYSKGLYSLSSKKKKKVWHNFRIHLSAIIKGSKRILLEDIFNKRYFANKKSITLSVNKDWFEHIQKNGWKKDLITEKAHFISKGDLRKCKECQNYFKKLNRFNYPKGYCYYSYSWLCDECYSTVKLKIIEWKQNKKNHHRKNSLG
jgi:hypothetical protein